MKRWIIRGFFVGVLLLCVGGWMWSYKYCYDVSYSGENRGVRGYFARVYGNQGELHLEGHDPDANYFDEVRGWHAQLYPASDYGENDHNYGGFRALITHGSIVTAIPFWFPTTISAALLWLVWRKTRPKVNGRAFPVELTEKQP